MADVPFKFDETKVKAHFDAVYKAHKEVEGKVGYNPFLYITSKVQPLAFRFERGERTKELQDAILALVVTPSKIG